LLPAVGTEAVDVGDDRAAAGAARRERKIERPARGDDDPFTNHGSLSLAAGRRTSATVPNLFDMELRALRRDRAARVGAELFLFERAFADCLERIALLQRRFDRALLIGSPNPEWPIRLGSFAENIDVWDPGRHFAEAAGGEPIVEDAWLPPDAAYDLALAVGTLDTVNDPRLALHLMRHAMREDGSLLGAMSGGETLPQLRAAMRVADAVSGGATPHVHPRIEASALGHLLSEAGFVDAVVDVDRVQVSYPTLNSLVGDLRAMGATNFLSARPRFMGKAARAAAIEAFAQAGTDDRTVETFEILHFAARAPDQP